MRRSRFPLVLLGAFLVLVLPLLACGQTTLISTVANHTATATATATATPTRSGNLKLGQVGGGSGVGGDAGCTAPACQVIERIATTTVQVQGTATVTAKCLQGEQLVSGGYVVPVVPGNIRVVESYPSSASTWTVTAVDYGSVSRAVNAFAYCLQASFSIGVVIPAGGTTSIAAGTSNSASAVCPSGGVATGGGFRLAPGAPAYVIASEPVPTSGWKIAAYAQSAPVTALAFVVCATTNVVATHAAYPATTFSVAPGSGGGASIAGCPAGQEITGGGFATSDPGAFTQMLFQFDGDNTPNAQLLQWAAGVNNNDTGATHTGTVTSVCI